MKKRSLILITVDCLRADHVGFQGNSCALTPFLDSLAKESIVFSNAIVAGVPTYFSFPAILASRYPLSLGRDVMGIAPNEPTIATALQHAGCRTAAFLAGNPYLSPRFGYGGGFETFHDFLTGVHSDAVPPAPTDNDRLSEFNRRLLGASRGAPWTASAYDELYFWYCQWRAAQENRSLDELRRYPSAEVIVDAACSWLAGIANQQFFLWIHLMDPHYPHYPPQEAMSVLGLSHITPRRARFLNSAWNRSDVGPKRLGRYREGILSLYDAGVYWVDKQISRLVGALRQSQRWDEAMFVFTADHGEEFLEHGGRYHSPATLAEELIHVPLLVHLPEQSRAQMVEHPFSLIHLAPTLMEALAVEIPVEFQGRSCWEQISNRKEIEAEPAIAESVGTGVNPLRREEHMRLSQMAIRGHTYKLVIDFYNETDRMYDLRNDPGERSSLPSRSLSVERVRLLQAARAHFEKTRHDPNSELALRTRLRELQHSMG